MPHAERLCRACRLPSSLCRCPGGASVLSPPVLSDVVTGHTAPSDRIASARRALAQAAAGVPPSPPTPDPAAPIVEAGYPARAPAAVSKSAQRRLAAQTADDAPEHGAMRLPAALARKVSAWAGERDPVEWLADAARLLHLLTVHSITVVTVAPSVTATPANVTDTRDGQADSVTDTQERDGRVTDVTDAKPLTPAQRQAKRRAAKDADARAAEAQRKREARARKADPTKG